MNRIAVFLRAKGLDGQVEFPVVRKAWASSMRGSHSAPNVFRAYSAASDFDMILFVRIVAWVLTIPSVPQVVAYGDRPYALLGMFFSSLSIHPSQ